VAFTTVDEDTLEAVAALWQTTPALTALFAKPPTFGRAKTPASQSGAVYAVIACEVDRRELIGTQGPWFDWRKVTITVYGDVKADVTNAAGCVLNVFNRDLGLAGFPTLTYPSGAARFMSWMPDGEVKLEEDKDTAKGKDVWKATLGARVWSVRTL
jgi:hypothetical protein